MVVAVLVVVVVVLIVLEVDQKRGIVVRSQNPGGCSNCQK
jgi:hypothetical protein